ncbi:MAG: hypothetical protein H7Y11_11175 [Armatimonadetes bacterium]|nr:hypothetical protein [Anaerolineae bacterium]
MLIIHDETTANPLQRIADQEQRPVEAVLKALLAQYPLQAIPLTPALHADADDVDARVRQMYLRAYTKARRYWQSVSKHPHA